MQEADKEQLIYRGVIVDKAKSNAEPIATNPANYKPVSGELPKGVKKVVYRGQTIYKRNGVVIEDPFALTKDEPETKVEAKKSKSKRIYRGQVIED